MHMYAQNDSAQRSSAPPRTQYNMKQCNMKQYSVKQYNTISTIQYDQPQLGPLSNPTGIDRPVCENAVSTHTARHALTLLASLARPISPRSLASLARIAPRLACCARFAWAASPACLLRSPPHTPHTPAGAALSLRHPSALACCSLHSPPPRLPLASLAAGRSACCSLSHLLVLLARLTRLARLAC